MGYTNETTHYSIPLPLGSDKTTPMDYNTSAQEVDTVLFEAKTDSASALQKANQLQQDLSTTNDNVTSVTGRVTTLEGTVTTQGQAITRHENEIRDVRQDAEDMIVAKELTQAQMNSSTEALAIGTYFRYNDVLYKVTQAISVGDTIVPNTNCVATNVASEFNQLNTSLAMVENGINTVSPSSELRISTNRYQLEFSVDTSTLSANTWNTIGSLPADANKNTATFNFEKSIVIVNEGGYQFAYPMCEEATSVQFRFDMISGGVQIYFTTAPSGFRICLEYSK